VFELQYLPCSIFTCAWCMSVTAYWCYWCGNQTGAGLHQTQLQRCHHLGNKRVKHHAVIMLFDNSCHFVAFCRLYNPYTYSAFWLCCLVRIYSFAPMLEEWYMVLNKWFVEKSDRLYENRWHTMIICPCFAKRICVIMWKP